MLKTSFQALLVTVALICSASVSSAEMLPFSDDRRIDHKDLLGMDAWQLRIARNEIFARKGYRFNSPELTAHFSQYAWYRPYTKKVSLSSTESFNVSFIKKYENSTGLLRSLQQRPLVNPTVVIQAPAQPAVIVKKDNSKELAKLQTSHDSLQKEIGALRRLIKSQQESQKKNSESFQEAMLNTLNELMGAKEVEAQKLVDASATQYSTPIKPSNPNIGDTVLELSKSFPKVPYYIAGTNQTGEMWLEPRVSKMGELSFNLNFVDPKTSYDKVIDTIELSSADVSVIQTGLEKTYSWSETAQKNNVRKRFQKTAACTNPTHCENKVQNDSSVQLDFLIYEDGATGTKLIQNKGKYSSGFNYSIESTLLLASYFGYVLDEGQKDFEAGSRTDEELNDMFN